MSNCTRKFWLDMPFMPILLHVPIALEPWHMNNCFGFRVPGFGFRVADFVFRVSCFGFRVCIPGTGFRVPGSGVRVSGFGYQVSCSGVRFSFFVFRFLFFVFGISCLEIRVRTRPKNMKNMHMNSPPHAACTPPPIHFTNPIRCEANSAHMRHSRPDSGLGSQVKALTPFSVVASSLGSRPEHAHAQPAPRRLHSIKNSLYKPHPHAAS